ncbi:glycosyltransferase [Halopenitus persicus]|uniref:glycosyltransferase n=1 Tax=Halopenitus persicus TaxID=1048396 RepID=UPI000BBAD4A7|nr:glycosyltransferase [Halopenitus persicus]
MTVEFTRETGGETPELSVVIVTYNEEERVRACIESVLDACDSLSEFEVILVDSNSTDRTVEYAVEYPITVLRIPSDDLTTPGAGRYVGTQAARGESILFVDGDMTVEKNWLSHAREYIARNGVAAVDGYLNRLPDETTIHEVDAVRGTALYDAASLRSVGGFDPQLRSLEDIHLGFLLTDAGYRLLRLPEVAARHPEPPTLHEPFRRWSRGYAFGPGQVLRRSVRSPKLLGKYISRFRYRIGTFAWLCVGVLALLAGSIALIAWVLLSMGAVAVVISERGIIGAIEFVLQQLLGIVGIAIGLRDRPRPRESFPIEAVEVVIEGPIHTGSTLSGV